MTIDKIKLKVLGKLFDNNFCDEKAISNMGLKEVVELRLTTDETTTLFELQNAVKKNKIISYLAGTKGEPEKVEQKVNSYSQY